MTKDEMSKLMVQIFNEYQEFREAGQKEYAHKTEDSFANFNRVAERLGIDRKAVLMVYAEKHIDGIHSFIQGHRSQREDVRGRIKDVIVYMCLLYGMVVVEESQREIEQIAEGHPSLLEKKYGALGWVDPPA